MLPPWPRCCGQALLARSHPTPTFFPGALPGRAAFPSTPPVEAPRARRFQVTINNGWSRCYPLRGTQLPSTRYQAGSRAEGRGGQAGRALGPSPPAPPGLRAAPLPAVPLRAEGGPAPAPRPRSRPRLAAELGGGRPARRAVCQGCCQSQAKAVVYCKASDCGGDVWLEAINFNPLVCFQKQRYSASTQK